MSTGNLIASLDLGTTKISTIIAEVDENGRASIIGVGCTEASGMQRGVVINMDKTINSIEQSVEKAEMMAGIEISSVFTGIAGDHIRSINSKGVIAIPRTSTRDRTGIIEQKDVDRVIEAAKAYNLPMDREVLHVLPQEFTVDEQTQIHDPIGMAGVRLEADVHIITGAVTSAQNIYRCIKQAGISVADLVLEPLASSYSVLTDDEKDYGVGLLDIGGGTTDIAVFQEHAIRHTSVIGIGGENVSRDLGVGLRTPYEHAVRIKLEHGHCYTPEIDAEEAIEIPGIGGRKTRVVSRMKIGEICQPRMEEIFELAVGQIRKAGVWEYLETSGVVLTGGGAQLEGAVELAEQIFQLPVKIGYPSGLGGMMSSANMPKHATGVGLILYGLNNADHQSPLRGDETTIFTKIFGRMREWFDDFF
ncbi:MAG: cell division protein FtsA [Candidatus Electryonea clarkiae]|nr:cell division protein FtsA [Candidatus Electryonea clarkiae]MDP8288723.1 cell division protein FtsA [Candidatus Electryonea clarkiae]